MGRTLICPYRIETRGGDEVMPRAWDSKAYGKPTPNAIEKMVVDYCRSTGIGEANEHIGKALGRIAKPPQTVRVIAQTGKRAEQVVAEWKCPMFLVI